MLSGLQRQPFGLGASLLDAGASRLLRLRPGLVGHTVGGLEHLRETGREPPVQLILGGAVGALPDVIVAAAHRRQLCLGVPELTFQSVGPNRQLPEVIVHLLGLVSTTNQREVVQQFAVRAVRGIVEQVALRPIHHTPPVLPGGTTCILAVERLGCRHFSPCPGKSYGFPGSASARASTSCSSRNPR